MNKIPVFFSSDMVAETKSVSPSSRKPSQVVASWARRFPGSIEIVRPEPVTVDDLSRAHDRLWVEDVLACRAANGFGNWSPAVAASLPHTSGAMLSAARHALKTGGVAAAPCSGFHHASTAHPEGFCTFNGLMVAALALLEEQAFRVGILDLDMHYGNGTEDIIEVTGTRNRVVHFTGGDKFYQAQQVPTFFNEWLPKALETLSRCDVVLYQAGADPHIDDPFGGWLTTEQLRIRDARVFDAFRAAGTPVAWNLAGGYQVEIDGSIPKVLEIHDNTMKECIRVYGGR